MFRYFTHFTMNDKDYDGDDKKVRNRIKDSNVLKTKRKKTHNLDLFYVFVGNTYLNLVPLKAEPHRRM